MVLTDYLCLCQLAEQIERCRTADLGWQSYYAELLMTIDGTLGHDGGEVSRVGGEGSQLRRRDIIDSHQASVDSRYASDWLMASCQGPGSRSLGASFSEISTMTYRAWLLSQSHVISFHLRLPSVNPVQCPLMASLEPLKSSAPPVPRL